MRLAALTAFALGFLGVAPAMAQDLRLSLPLDCDLGETCFIQQYVDLDPGPGRVDFTGGLLTYDGHKGTDFRVADIEAMEEGVPVLAPAPGRVRGIRDEMADRLINDRSEVAGRECGNGVAIDHGDGWETQLCHLALGSVIVKPGDEVARGDKIGEIGLSGATQFPHVHLAVRQNGEVVDPFVAGLWQDRPDYEPGGLLSAGFSSAIPEFEAVKDGTADAPALSTSDGALVFWAYMFGSRAGDTLRLTIVGPPGFEPFSHSADLDRPQAELFRAAGRRAPPAGWPAGTYTGAATLIRDGQELDRLVTTIAIR